MGGIFLALAVVTLLQLIICKFSLWWIICLVCRLLFCCRIFGATIKIKKLAIGELVAIGSMFFFNLLFASEGFPWLRFVLFIVFCGVALVLEYIDDLLNVYVIEDEEDYNGEID